ncbi:MAG: formimidoylglutamase [Flavobacteriales bacterium]
MQNIIPLSEEELGVLTILREGESKLGEFIHTDYKSNEVKFVLLGIPEDIGSQANCGLPGAKNTWPAFLKAFLNIQHNDFNKQKVSILGSVDTQFLYKKEEKDVIKLRELTDQLDEIIYPIIKKLIELDKIPIVIGGGHNNSYPLLKGSSLALNHSVNCVNIDPHADLRSLEGRHSGNGFSYAFNEGFLHYYHVLGLHENYNSQFILNEFSEHKNLSFTSYESFLKNKYTLSELAARALQKTTAPLALEVDMDSIAYMPSSALSPSGFTLDQVRHLLYLLTRQNHPVYLHISEAAPTNTTEEKIIGKAISYIVTDFIKAYE